MDEYDEIDNLYKYLGIADNKTRPNNELNTGDMKRKLNTGYSIIKGEKLDFTWNYSVKMKKEENDK